MKRFIKPIIYTLYYVLITVFLVNVSIKQLTIQEKVEQLEVNTKALSEWYIELKYQNLDLEDDIRYLEKEDIRIYEQIVKGNKRLHEFTSITIEGFKETNKFLGSINSKFVKSENLIKKNNQELKEALKQPSYDYLKSVTVYIEGTSTKEQWGGTGIIIKSGIFNTYILTNAHMVGKNKENVTLYVENVYGLKMATIVKIHDKLDLALIKINGELEGKRAIKGISIRIRPQDKVYLVGQHLGRKYVYGEGVFAGYDGIKDIIQIPVLYGNSGSGVFDKNGRLVSLIFAINTFGFFDVDCSHGLGINSLNIIHFLRGLL